VVEIQIATPSHLPEVLEWLRVEDEQTGSGFYCNRNVVENSFADGDGLCATAEGEVVGFVVLQMFAEGGDVHIVEVMPTARRQGLGSQLLLAAVEVLRQRGAKYVDVECTSAEGERLCRPHGFEDYADPWNHRGDWDNPTLRLYLSDWRPKARHPWS
jgi:GNAT superfamily N-acetyltransferase